MKFSLPYLIAAFAALVALLLLPRTGVAAPDMPAVLVGAACAPDGVQPRQLSRALSTYLGVNAESTETADALVAQARPDVLAVDNALQAEISKRNYQAAIAVWCTSGRAQLLFVLPQRPAQPDTLLSVDISAIPPLHLNRVLALKLRTHMHILRLVIPASRPVASTAPSAVEAGAVPAARPWGVELGGTAVFSHRWPYFMGGFTSALLFGIGRWELGLEGGLSIPRRRSFTPAMGRLWSVTLALRAEVRLLASNARRFSLSLRGVAGAAIFGAKVSATGLPSETQYYLAPLFDGLGVLQWRVHPLIEWNAGLGVRFLLRPIEYTVVQQPFYTSVPVSPLVMSAVRFRW